MVTHVAMQTINGGLAALPARRTSADAYANTADVTVSASNRAAEPRDGSVPAVDPEALQKAVQDLRRGVQNLQRSLEFSVDEASGRTVIKVVDKETKEVIRQIPEEDVLALAARLEDAQSGMLVKEEA